MGRPTSEIDDIIGNAAVRQDWLGERIPNRDGGNEMTRYIVLLLAVGAIACNGQKVETDEGSGPASGTGSVSAAQGESEAGAAIHPSVTGCLDLVRAGRFADAIAPCTEAVRRAPDNQQVADALERAREGAAQQAAAAAQESGAAAAEEAAKDLTDRVP
jgi:hypothetical protein